MLSRNRFKRLTPKSNKSDDESSDTVSGKQGAFFTPKHEHKIYWRHIVILLCLWFGVIHYYERIVVKRVIKRCDWSRWEKWPPNATPHRVGLFADPQLLDSSSYPNRTWAVNQISKLVVDNYHRRNWKFVQYWLDPDTNFFLGDLFDGGRYCTDEEWMEEYKRFNNIFPKVPFKRTIMSIPGNHDIGFGDGVLEHSLQRFTAFYGEASNYLDIGNHTFVLVDTISMSDNADPKIASVPRKFLDEFASGYHPLPRIMLSHVPLWRDPKALPCGPGRESTIPFPIERGKGYQTVIDGYITPEVLSKVQPEVIFCGDDHDYCHITQTYNVNGVPKTAEEYTVKSCAMNMGVRYPAIQLISLYNPDATGPSPGKQTYQTEMCYLPDADKAMYMYLLTFIVSTGWFAYMLFFPVSFNKNIAIKMGKATTNTISSLPLPVSSPHGLRLMRTKYHIEEKPTSTFKAFLINYALLMTSVGCIFMYFFKTI